MASDIQDWEKPAAVYGGKCGMEYLSEIGEFDLSKLSPEQLNTFIQVTCLQYHMKRIEIQAS